jgi:tRNA-dihydrouridine synthase B
MKIGQYKLSSSVLVAPMAGVTDRPYRQLCKKLGAAYAVSEMAASNPALWNSVKTSRRINHEGEIDPRAVQIAGGDPTMMAQAAAFNADRGAQIIDINMGCPAKKVCSVAAGSALMSDLPHAMRIIESVVAAVDIPVTLKIRTGPTRQNNNGIELARCAEQAGIQMLVVHGRSRECAFQGGAEYDTIAQIKSDLSIPVVANGDIDSGPKAKSVLDYTGADAVMVGRAAQGRPWIFRQIAHYLSTGETLPDPTLPEIHQVLREHLLDHYKFHGEFTGVRSARKHVGWYLANIPNTKAFLAQFYSLESAEEQIASLDALLNWVAANDPIVEKGRKAA